MTPALRTRLACLVRGHDIYEDKPYLFRCRRCRRYITMSDLWAAP